MFLSTAVVNSASDNLPQGRFFFQAIDGKHDYRYGKKT